MGARHDLDSTPATSCCNHAQSAPIRMVNRVIYGVISGWHEIAERIVYNVCIDFSMARNVFPLNCLPKIALLVPVYTE